MSNFVSSKLQIYLEGRIIAEERIINHLKFHNPFIISQDYGSYLICAFSLIDLCAEKEKELHKNTTSKIIDNLKKALQKYGNNKNNYNNYYYLRELRNAFTHRGITFMLYENIFNDKTITPRPPKSITNQKQTEIYYPFSDTLIEAYRIIDMEMMPLISDFVYTNKLLPEPYDDIYEERKKFLDEETNYNQDLKSIILDLFKDNITLQEVHNDETDRFNDRMKYLLSLSLQFTTN